MKKFSEMTDAEMFQEVFNYLAGKYTNLSMKGTLVYYGNECIMNTDGYNLAYNLYRLTDALKENGEFN